MYLSAVNQNTPLDGVQPARTRIDSIGIGVSPERNGQSPFIDLTPGYQFLAVGEQNPNTFALGVDKAGIVINSPFLNRSDPANQYALLVDGDVRVTGAILAQTVLTYDASGSAFNGSAGVWGVAFPNLGAYYEHPVVIGNSNAALSNNNGLQILRDAFHNWNNAQLRIDNQAGAQLNFGFMGAAKNSPAIVQTPPGVGIEFHAGHDAAYFARHYVVPTLQHGNSYLDAPYYAPSDGPAEYPHLAIDANGNVGIHTNAPASYTTHRFSALPPYTSTSSVEKAVLDVRGTLFASNILMYDYVANAPVEINEMFFRKDGIIVSAPNVGAGAFMEAPFSFPGNLAVATSNDSRYSLNVGGSAQISDTMYVRSLTKTENLEAVSSVLTVADILSDIRVRERLFIDAGVFVKVFNSNSIVLATSNIALSYYGSNNSWVDANGATAPTSWRLGCNVLTVPSIATFDGLQYPGGDFVENATSGLWTDATSGGAVASVTFASNIGGGYYVDTSGHVYYPPSAAVAAWPLTLEVFVPSVAASLTSNFVAASYAPVNFSVASEGLCNVNYNGIGINTPGRFGCGIAGTDAVGNQLVSIKRDPSVYGLEVTDQSDEFQRIKRTLLVGHRNFNPDTNPSDYGATLFVTPSMDDTRYQSPSIAHNATFAQHMYFLPGYDFLHKNVETDAALTPSLALLGDGTGRVGVGTRAPTATLHVEGDLYVSGGLRDAVAPIAPFHAIQFTTPSGAEKSAATFRTAANAGIQHVSVFAPPDERVGLVVGSGIMADRYHTPEGFRLGELLLYDGNLAAPTFSGSNLFTMHSLAVGTSTPNPALALEVVSANNTKTRARITRNGASPDVSMELYSSEFNQWAFNGTYQGKLTVANIGSNVPSANAALAALSAVYSNGSYRVGINTATAYRDGAEPVLLVNGNTTVVGDLNVTGRYLQAGRVVIDATSNAATVPGQSTAVTLGDEDVFLGGKEIYINPRGTVHIGALVTPSAATDVSVLRVHTTAPNASASASVPLAQFITDAPTGHLEILVNGATSSLRMEYGANSTFRILSSASSSLPYMTFTNHIYDQSPYQNLTVNTPTNAVANGTITQMHDVTGGQYNALMLSAEGGGSGPKLALTNMIGNVVSSQWTVQGPGIQNNKLAFAFGTSSKFEVLTLTNDGRVGIGFNAPAFGVDLRGGTAALATLSATSTTLGTPAMLRLAVPEAAYVFEASANNVLLQRTDAHTAQTVTIAHIASNGSMSIGADTPPDPGYALTVAGKVNVTGGVYMNHIPLFAINDINYVNSSGLQYFIPGYGGVVPGLMSGGMSVGVSATTITSNLFYVSNHYDGATAVFESDSPDAHVNLYSKPPSGTYAGGTEAVARFGVSNVTGGEAALYLALRSGIAQSPSLFVDPSPEGFDTLAKFTRAGSVVNGPLASTGPLSTPALDVGGTCTIGGRVELGAGGTLAMDGSNVFALASNELRGLVPMRLVAGVAVDDILPNSSNAVTVHDLNIVGSLSINGIPFTDGFSEFTAGGAKYVVGVGGGIDSVTWQAGTTITLGTTPGDVPFAGSPLTVAGLGTVPDAPGTGDLVRMAWAGAAGAPSPHAALALGRNGASGTRLDIRAAGPVPGITVTSDASGVSRVGIGGVTAPRFALDVSGDINVSGGFFQSAQSININNVLMITPGGITPADQNVIINARYCGVGTATADPSVPNVPLDVHNNVGGPQLARFITSNASGSMILVAGDGGTRVTATISVDASGLHLDSMGGVSLSAGSGGLTMGMSSSGALSFAGSDRLAFDASGGATLLGYRFGASSSTFDGALTLAPPGSPHQPFVYFYGASGGVGIGSASYPFNVLQQNLENNTASTINGEPLRLLVNGAISCTAISSFTGQHIVALNHPVFKKDYLGLIVSLTGRLIDNAYSLVQSTPLVEFSRTRMEKAAYGVLSSCQGGSSYAWVCLANSVGEGAMWVCNANGDIAIGDYITSSSVAGYGMRQADDLLHNYTVAKASVSVAFGCPPDWMQSRKFTFKDPFDREIKYVTACMVPVTYHCG